MFSEKVIKSDDIFQDINKAVNLKEEAMLKEFSHSLTSTLIICHHEYELREKIILFLKECYQNH